jgi:hypothetical protein
MKLIYILLLAIATLTGCNVPPTSLSDVPNKSNFSEKQLMEAGITIKDLQLTSGWYPNFKSAVIENSLDNTWNAVLGNVAGTEKVKDFYSNQYKLKLDDFLKFINSEEFQGLARDWGQIKFRMANVNFISKNNKNKNHAQIIIDSAEYNPEDAIEGSTGRTFFENNPLINRSAYVVIHFHENEKKQTIVTVLNFMSYGVRSGNGSLAYPTHWERFQAISKGNIENSIINNIVNVTAKIDN